jgi:hypothetical protein
MQNYLKQKIVKEIKMISKENEHKMLQDVKRRQAEGLEYVWKRGILPWDSVLSRKTASFLFLKARGKGVWAINIRLRGDWMFIKTRDDFEVECIYQPFRNSLGESWGTIPWEKSPFVEKNKKRIAQLIDDLNKLAKVGPYKVINDDKAIQGSDSWKQIFGSF